MKNDLKLSVVISAFNEEKKIQECLESVSFADEIIVIDNSSIDSTKDIAKRFTQQVYTKPNNLMLNVNKNYGIAKANGEWILSVDADERITKELKDEILAVLQQEKSVFSGYWIPRKNIIFGKWMRHTGWYPDYQLRLFKKGMGKFEEKHVHEMISISGESAKLQGQLLHINFESLAQFIQKHGFIYAPNEADVKIKGGYELQWKDVIWFPAREFISRFFAREGYKDGFHGLALSLLMAFYHLLIFAYIWERKNFKQIDNPHILEESKKEFKTVGKEMELWFVNERMKQAKSFLEKLKVKAESLF